MRVMRVMRMMSVCRNAGAEAFLLRDRLHGKIVFLAFESCRILDDTKIRWIYFIDKHLATDPYTYMLHRARSRIQALTI